MTIYNHWGCNPCSALTPGGLHSALSRILQVWSPEATQVHSCEVETTGTWRYIEMAKIMTIWIYNLFPIPQLLVKCTFCNSCMSAFFFLYQHLTSQSKITQFNWNGSCMNYQLYASIACVCEASACISVFSCFFSDSLRSTFFLF